MWNSITARNRPEKRKIIDEPSQTVPDQTMSIRQIMSRHVRGIDNSVVKTPIYQESSGVNPKTLDLVDVQEIRMEHQERIKSVEKGYNEAREKKAYEKARKQAEADLNQKIKEEAEAKNREKQ